MTREEAIKILKKCRDTKLKYTFYTLNEYQAATDMAIKALEQESVPDKIKAEIEQVKSIMNEEIINHDRKDLINFVNGLNQSLVIIDKCKAESEDKE